MCIKFQSHATHLTAPSCVPLETFGHFGAHLHQIQGVWWWLGSSDFSSTEAKNQGQTWIWITARGSSRKQRQIRGLLQIKVLNFFTPECIWWQRLIPSNRGVKHQHCTLNCSHMRKYTFSEILLLTHYISSLNSTKWHGGGRILRLGHIGRWMQRSWRCLMRRSLQRLRQHSSIHRSLRT